MMISVVVPLFNKAPVIAVAVESVLAQSYSKWELIVVDDGSTDGGGEVIAQYKDARIRIIRQPNRGVSVARNTGLATARSNLVAFLDADDFWHPDHLSGLANAARLLPDCVFWSSAYRIVDERGRLRESRFPLDHAGHIVRIDDYFAHARRYDDPVNSSTVMVNRDVLIALGGFPESVRLGEDLVTWAKLACQGALGYVGRATSFYVRPVNWRGRESSLQRPQVPDEVRRLLDALPEPSRNAGGLTRFRADWHRNRSMMFLEIGERWEALRELGLACRCGGPRARDLACIILLSLPLRLRLILLWLVRKRRLRGSAANHSKDPATGPHSLGAERLQNELRPG
jgi:hypothetical protein